jgi:hypothetical protein
MFFPDGLAKWFKELNWLIRPCLGQLLFFALYIKALSYV